MRALLIAASCVLSCMAYAGGCPPVKLKPGEAVDQACHVYRVVKQNGKRVIESRGRLEEIDCAKATRDPFGGWYDYNARIVEARFACPAPKDTHDLADSKLK